MGGKQLQGVINLHSPRCVNPSTFTKTNAQIHRSEIRMTQLFAKCCGSYLNINIDLPSMFMSVCQASNPFHLWGPSLIKPLSELPDVHFKVTPHTPT
jgi:hypothetical protein